MKKQRKKLRVAVVMPNHADLHSSLNNYVKTYQHLVKKGLIEVVLFTDSSSDLALKGIKIEKTQSLDYGNVLGSALFVLGIPRCYCFGLQDKLKGFDVIVANNPEFYAYAYQAYQSAKREGSRFILRTSQTVDGFFLYKVTKWIVNPIVRGAYRYAGANIFSNPEAEERCLRLGLIEESDRGRSVITGHPIDTNCFTSFSANKPSNQIILSVGGLYKLKGHQYIIQALKLLHDKGLTDAMLWIVGKGAYENSLRKLAKNLGVEEKVVFLGALGHEDLARVYNRSDVFVLANEQEITPAVSEALACAVPVVVMETGGVSFVVSKDVGCISKKYDVKDMAAKIEYVLKNRGEAKRKALNGKIKVIKRFSIEKVAMAMYKAFRG
jgi:glycosyltransferase involved in cell wall biosynthesis